MFFTLLQGIFSFKNYHGSFGFAKFEIHSKNIQYSCFIQLHSKILKEIQTSTNEDHSLQSSKFQSGLHSKFKITFKVPRIQVHTNSFGITRMKKMQSFLNSSIFKFPFFIQVSPCFLQKSSCDMKKKQKGWN